MAITIPEEQENKVVGAMLNIAQAQKAIFNKLLEIEKKLEEM
jgi:hypothetical protein